ncbi:MAG: ORF6N domain-containing protein [Filifactor alocis]|uniref:ORF6N domain-containing protein n=1 Tax=Filifactor alocis TaxID=143361 RepID=UPI003F9F6262
MKEVVTIAGKDIMAKTYQGKRVVTFKDIDFVHERPEGTAKRNFNENKDKFIEGVDYYHLSKDEVLMSEFRTLENDKDNLKYENRTLEISNRGMLIFTETGYLMLVKSLKDDLAWRVQRELVSSYFRAKELSNNNPMLMMMSQMEKLIIGTSKLLENVVERLEKLEKQERGSKFHTENVTSVVQIDYDNNIEAIRVGLMLRGKNKTHCKMDEVDDETRRNALVMIVDGSTYDEVAKYIQSRGYDISSRAVARYGKKVFELMSGLCK